ncbi:DNA methylase [Endozoicomonas montiporae]|uniref:DNA methylase n=2 Tax=Endozoicomonas montiporae TaxID=1027273 RepID=A0A081N3C9_9GAMM|nr:site-specific DNA-methyltransferase [Endozoicomonas montiporae]AMO58250.1 adenine-specific DNA-methyltransferase [Endozoicomonas montiporae CL-33]KEQ12952.1 DNA methylase [Endozoicomonas montiporae]
MPVLDWLNKGSAIRTASQTPYRLLKHDPELSYGDPDSDNLLIQGDNLEALKALIPLYAGQVKCIYVDPPFNTKQAFEHYDDNLEHSIWLSLLYPRFELLRELLSEDGTLFVHIDDSEVGYLTVMLDEIFGRKNRTHIVAFKQGSATGHKAINPGMVNTCNFVLSYAKNKEYWKPNTVYTGRERDSRYSQFIENYEDSYEQWKVTPLLEAFSKSTGITKKNIKKHFGDSFEKELTAFVVSHSERVIRTARPDYNAVGEDVRRAIDASKSSPDRVHLHTRKSAPNMYLKNGERWIFYKEKLKNIDGVLVTGEPLTTLWADVLSNNLHNEGGVKFPKSKKPEALLKRIIDLSSDKGDLVLDSFLGSGTTAAVAHKMNRRYIGIEMGDHAVTHCAPRLQKVVDGEQGGISKAVEWQGGGGFRFYRLGETVYDEYGCLNQNIGFDTLAGHIWYNEIRKPVAPLPQTNKTPLLGVHNGVAYYLLYNGILGDRRPDGGNVLTTPVLKSLPPFDGPKVIYGETSRLGESRLAREQITFKQIPYDVKAR